MHWSHWASILRHSSDIAQEIKQASFQREIFNVFVVELVQLYIHPSAGQQWTTPHRLSDCSHFDNQHLG